MNEGIFSRTGIVGLVLSLLGGLILFQMARIQSSPSGQELEAIARRNYEYSRILVQPERGNIYDRWGSLLAGNREVYEVGLNLVDVRSPQTIARDLADILDLKYEDVLAKALVPYEKGKNEYLVVASFVSPEKIAGWRRSGRNIGILRSINEKPGIRIMFRPVYEALTGSRISNVYILKKPWVLTSSGFILF
jgi:cell division protein FtsI/penicillin-binding protein 2